MRPWRMAQVFVINRFCYKPVAGPPVQRISMYMTLNSHNIPRRNGRSSTSVAYILDGRCVKNIYRQIYNISRTKSQNLNT